MKTILAICLVILCQLGFASSAYAVELAHTRPIYTSDAEQVLNSGCKAVAWMPYSGNTYYRCDNAENFWSYIMVNAPGSPLFMYNHKQEDDEQAAMDAAAASSMMYSYN